MARTRRTRGGGGGRGGRGGGQRIVLQTVAPPLQGPGLNQSLAKLRELNAEVAKFNAGVAGLTGGLGRLVNLPKMRSLESIEQQLRGATKTMATGLKPENVAKVFGLSTQEMERGLADFRAKIQQGQVKLTGGRKARMQDFFGTGESAGEFASMRRAAQFMKDMLDDQRRMAEQIQRTLFPQSQVVRSEPGAATSARRAAGSGTPPPPRQPGPALADLTTRLQREQSQLAKVVAARDRLARQMEAAPAGGPPAGTGGPPVLPIAPRLAKADQALAARRARVTELERELAQRAAQEGPRPATPPTPAPDLQERLEREKAQLAKVQAARQRLAAAPPPAPAQQMLLPTQEFRAGAFQPARPDPRMAKVDRAIAQRQSRIAEMEKAAAVSAPAAPVSVQTPAPGAPPAPRMTAPVPNLTAPVPTVPVAAGTMVAMTLRGDQIVATLVPPPIRLEVPGSLIQATVVGPVTAQPAGGGAGGGGMPHRDPTTGQFLPPGGGGGAGGGGGGGGSEEPAGEGGGRRRRRRGREGGVSDADIERLRRLPVTDDELRRVITRTEEDAQIEITRALGPFQKRTEKRSLSGGLRVEKVREEDDRGARLRKEINDRLAAEKAALETRLASYKGVEKTAGSLRGQAAEVRQTQASLQSFIRQRMPAAGDQGPMAEETRAQLGRIQQRVDRMRITANNLDLAAAQAELQAAGIADKEAKKQLQHLLNLSRQRAKTQAKQAQLNAQIAQQQAQMAQAQQQQQMVAAQFAAHQAQANQLMAGGYTQGATKTKTFTGKQGGGQQQTTTFQPTTPGQPTVQWVTQMSAAGQVVGSAMTAVQKPIQQVRGLFRGLIADANRSLLQIAKWHTSVAVFYGSIATVVKAFQTAAQVQLQTARLEQVFRGVGGSAQALSMDVIRLAAAEGRLRDEAMESAIAWSRLGTTRREVNEAVRVSLMAANVAELDAASAGQFLTSIMQAYGLRIMDLNKVLGYFNALTNTSKATNKELFQGLAQTANVAKEAGLSLDTLAAVLAVTIEKSGQTGSRIGTAMKSTIIALANPEIQKLLRQQYSFEITTEGGTELQDMEQVLAKLFILYSNLNDKRKEELLVMIAGKTQANRLAAFLDSYTEGLVRAANAQRHLNSAEEESAKIRATVISQWQGLGSAVAATVVQIDRAAGGTKALAEYVRLLKNLVRAGTEFMDTETPSLGSQIAKHPIGQLIQRIVQLGQFTFSSQMRGIAAWNLLLDSATGGADAFTRSLEPMQRNLRDAEGRVKSLQTTLQLLQVIQKSLANASPEQQRTLVEQVGELETISNAKGFAAELGKAAAARNQQQISDLTQAQASEIHERTTQQIKAAQKELDAIRAAYAARIKSRPDTEAGRAEREQLEKERTGLEKLKKQINAWNDEELAAEGFAATSLQVKTALEQIRVALAGVQNLMQQRPAFGISGELDREIQALEEQEKIINRLITENKENESLASLHKNEIGRQLGTDLERVQAELAAKRSPLTRDLARQAEERRQIAEISRAQGEAFDFGMSRAARALNREGGLQFLIGLKTRAAALTNDEKHRTDLLAGVEVHRVQLAEARLQKEKERFEVLKDEFEYNRKMLTSGPAELIRKVVAARILQQGTPTGAQFLGYSTEMRQTLMEEVEHRQNRAFLQESSFGGVMEQWARSPSWMQDWLAGPAWLRTGAPTLQAPARAPALTPVPTGQRLNQPAPQIRGARLTYPPAAPLGGGVTRQSRTPRPGKRELDADTVERVREHWQKRIREAMAIPDPKLREREVESAQAALSDFEARRKKPAAALAQTESVPQQTTPIPEPLVTTRPVSSQTVPVERGFAPETLKRWSNLDHRKAGSRTQAKEELAPAETVGGFDAGAIKRIWENWTKLLQEVMAISDPERRVAALRSAQSRQDEFESEEMRRSGKTGAETKALPQPAPMQRPGEQPVPVAERSGNSADRVRTHWRKRIDQAMEIPDPKLREQEVGRAQSALDDWERRQSERGRAAESRASSGKRMQESIARNAGSGNLRLGVQVGQAAQMAIENFERRQSGGAGMAQRVQAHLRKRLQEAMAIPDINLRQEQVRAAQSALEDFERRQSGKSNTADRVRTHWQKRLQEAMTISDPGVRQVEADAAQRALNDYEKRQRQKQTQTGSRSAVVPGWVREMEAARQPAQERTVARTDLMEAGLAAVAMKRVQESATGASVALSSLLTVSQYVEQIGTAVNTLQARVDAFAVPALNGPPRLAQAHG